MADTWLGSLSVPMAMLILQAEPSWAKQVSDLLCTDDEAADAAGSLKIGGLYGAAVGFLNVCPGMAASGCLLPPDAMLAFPCKLSSGTGGTMQCLLL